MHQPLEVTFRGLDSSPTVEANVHERVEKLERFCDEIIGCRVMIEAPHRHHHKGNIYHVRIDLTLPGKEIVIKRDPKRDQAHEDIYVALRDAFDAARRRVEDYVRRRRQHVKHHETPPHGAIKQLFPEMDYGIIVTPDNREIYFHRNCIVDADFSKLSEGMEVRFVEQPGEHGPQASTVKLVGKHHVVG